MGEYDKPIEWEPYSTDTREQEDAFIANSATVATVSTGGSGIALGGSLIGVRSAPERSVNEGVSKTPEVSLVMTMTQLSQKPFGPWMILTIRWLLLPPLTGAHQLQLRTWPPGGVLV